MRRTYSGFPASWGAATLALLFSTVAMAQAQTGRIEGVVRIAGSDTTISNVSVVLRGTSIGAKSSTSGAFAIANVRPGQYVLAATALGYQLTEQPVTVADGHVIRVILEMTPRDIDLKGVTVSSDRDRSYVASISSTATKTSTPLRDVPASIVVVPAIVLKDQGASSLDQTIRNVSGITQSSQSNYGFFNNFTVRGLRQRFLRDGVPDGPTTNGYARTLTDVDHVEVLKGPGSALYGSSEPGGSINLVSKPTYSKPTLSISQSAGSFNSLRTAVDAGGALADNLRSRISLAYSRKDGFRNIGNTTIEVLPMVTFAPSEAHTLTVSGTYRKVDQEADTYGTPFRGTTLLDVPPEFDYHTPFATTSQEITQGSISHLWRAGEQTMVRTNVMLMKRKLYLLRNAGGAVSTTSDTMSARSLRRQNDDANDLIAQVEPAFRLETGSLTHTVLTGVEYQRSHILAARNTASLPTITDVKAPVAREVSVDSLKFKTDFDRDITLNQVGVFAQDQVTISERFKARAGVRWDLFGADDIHHTDTLGDKRSDGYISGQVGLVFQPVTELSLYAGVAHGALSTVSTESARISEPETSTQYELGSKASLMDGLLQVNAAAFYVTREHFNVTIGVDQLPVGAQRTQGIELDLSSQPTEAWGITGNFAYYDAKITNNPSDTGAIGKRPVGVAPTTASLWTTYTLPSGIVQGLGFGGGLTYRDAMYLDAHNTRSIPSYITIDATFFYRTRLIEVQINLENVGDAEYFRNGVNSGALPGDPRSIRGSLRLNF